MKKILLALLVIVFLVFIRFFSPVTARVASDFPYIFPEQLVERFSIPQTWYSINVLGENASVLLWSFPTNLFYGLGNIIGMGFPWLERIFGVLPIILIGAVSIVYFLKHHNVKNSGLLVGAVLYMLNSYFLLLIDGGQLLVAGAFALFPLVYVLFDKATVGDLKAKMSFALSLVGLGFFDIRFVYVFAYIGLVHVIYHRVNLKTILSTATIAGVILLLSNFFWLLPSYLFRSGGVSFYTGTTSELANSAVNLGHTLLFLQPQWYKNIFGSVTPALPAFLILPLLAFLAPLVSKNKKSVGFWLIIAVSGIFLAKGATGPLGNVYVFMFDHIPGFNLFRDSTKFFFLMALSYSYLVAETTSVLASRFKTDYQFLGKRVSVLATVIIIYFVVLARPAYLNRMIGFFSTRPNESEFQNLANKLREDKNFGRVLWLPSLHPFGFASSVHPSLDAFRIYNRHPLAIGVVGSYELFNFIREAKITREVFDVLGIKYIAYPSADERGKELKQEERDYYKTFSDQIAALPWIKGRLSDPPTNFFETKSSQEHFFVANNTFAILGSERIYDEFLSIPNFHLAKNALTFIEESPAIVSSLPHFAKIIVYKKTPIDMIAGFVGSSHFVFPANSLPTTPKENGWWKRMSGDYLNFRDFLQTKYKVDSVDFDYGGGWAISEGDHELTISDKSLTKDNILLGRVMGSSSGGKVEFWQSDTKLSEINTKITNAEKTTNPISKEVYDQGDFAWFELGKLSKDKTLTIKTSGAVNVVNSLATVSQSEWDSLKSSIDKKVNDGDILIWESMDTHIKENLLHGTDDVKVSTTRMSPTHYKVKVTGTTSPVTLAFSDAFDPNWSANGTKSFRIFSMINGFPIEKDGEYDVFFEPQKYVLPGLVVSLLTILTTIIFIRKRKIARYKPS